VQAAVEPTVARAGELRLSESPDFQLRIGYLRHRRNAVSLAPMMNRFQSRTPVPDTSWFDAARPEEYGGIEYGRLPVVLHIASDVVVRLHVLEMRRQGRRLDRCLGH
jgi:hypothetical protein